MFKFIPFVGIFAGIQVEQLTTAKSNIIRVTGFRTRYFLQDIDRLYKTSRTSKYMFHKVGSTYLEIRAFFGLEFDKVLTDLQAKSNSSSSRWTAMRVQKALRENTWLRNLDVPPENIPQTLNLKQLKKFKKTPLDYQMKFLTDYDSLSYRLGLNGVLLDAVMGSGKTLMSLYIAECSEVDHVVVVCPKNALDRVWANTLKTEISPAPSHWTSETPRSYSGEKYIIVHMEAMDKVLDLVDTLSKTKRVAVIVDECHNFNEMTSARSQTLVRLCHAAKSSHIILQSGTMFKAIGAEIITAMYIIDPTFDEVTAEAFKRLYSASATEALKLLQYRLGFFTYKVVQEQVGLGSPDTQIILVQTPDSAKFTLAAISLVMKKFIADRIAYYDNRRAKDYAEYERILAQYVAEIPTAAEHKAYRDYRGDVDIIRRGDLMNCKEEIKAANVYENKFIIPTLSPQDKKSFTEVKTIYKYVILKIQGECLGQVLGRLRIEACVSIAKAFDYEKYIESTVKKTLIYTNYIESLQAATDAVKAKGYEPLMVYGATNKNINEIIKGFESNPEMNPLLATFSSLSTAVPLTTADLMILLDQPWRSYVLEQTIARIHRLGKDSQTRVYICKMDTGADPNISSRTLDVLQWSQSQIYAITGTRSPFEIDEKQIAVESYARVNRPLELIDHSLEESFMRPLI